MDPRLLNPTAIAARGEAIYAAKYRGAFEERHRGDFAVIDVETEAAYLGASPEAAYAAARAAGAAGPFHLIRIGDVAAYRVSSCLNAGHLDWVFR